MKFASCKVRNWNNTVLDFDDKLEGIFSKEYLLLWLKKYYASCILYADLLYNILFIIVND